MLQHDWLNSAQPPADQQRHAPRYHRQLEETNTSGLIRTATGLQMLMHLVSDYLDLLGTAAAVFEKDGTYAVRLCASGWCRTLDAASRRLCGTDDHCQALRCGTWQCHESCWAQAAKPAIENGQPTDIACAGGLRIHALPIHARGEIVGALTLSYGDPPRDPLRVRAIADRYAISEADLHKVLETHATRPAVVSEMAKRRLAFAAHLIGEIVEHKQTEMALAESQRSMAVLLRNLPGMAYRCRNDAMWTMEFVSHGCLNLTGYQAEELTGAHAIPYADLIVPDDRQMVWDMVQQGVEQQRPFVMVYRIRTKGGEEKWVWEQGMGIADSAGAVTTLEGFITDITEHKRTEEALRASEAYQRAIISAAPNLVVGLDAHARIVLFNRFAEQLTGYAEDEVLGQNWIELFIPPELRNDIRALWETITARRLIQHHFDNPIITKTGVRLLISWNNTVLTDGGAFRMMLSIGEDVTERRRAEERERQLQAQLTHAQRMESIGRLAGGIAHDFNNMLTVILGTAELAMRKVDPAAPLHQDLCEILNAAQHSAGVTRQLLAFARQQTIAPRALDLNATIGNMLSMLRRLIGENIELAWRPAAMPLTVMMDPSQMDQILTNLCVNARDAITDVGRIAIETDRVLFDDDYCAGHAGAAPGAFAVLLVSDDGRGMDAHTQEKLFEPFFTTKGTGKGIGLGLATVYGIVKQNNGFINVYSEPDRGTTFRIYLPWHARQISAAPPARAETVPQGHGETILVVEDEAGILKLSQLMLEELGYRVLTAAKPSAALQLARSHAAHIDLLITDVVMSEMNGRDLAQQLLALHPHLKVLFMSGYTADVIAHRGMLDQGVHFVQKPFSSEDFARSVHHVLEGPV